MGHCHHVNYCLISPGGQLAMLRCALHSSHIYSDKLTYTDYEMFIHSFPLMIFVNYCYHWTLGMLWMILVQVWYESLLPYIWGLLMLCSNFECKDMFEIAVTFVKNHLSQEMKVLDASLCRIVVVLHAVFICTHVSYWCPVVSKTKARLHRCFLNTNYVGCCDITLLTPM